MEGTESDEEGEDDYMSDAFLQQLQDVRPGLLSKSRKRQRKIDEKRTKNQLLPKQKRINQAEKESREHALSIPLATTNKGFSMLQKMGYKKGMGLGKEGAGRTSLIPLVIKDGRSGLGRRGFVEEKKATQKVQEAQTMEEFRQRKQHQTLMKKTESDLRKSQLACEQLDTQAGISTPSEEWFWTEESQQLDEVSEDESGDDEELEIEVLNPSVKLGSLNSYLRTKHYYCIWCGTAYQDEDDMNQHCPGDNEDLHD